MKDFGRVVGIDYPGIHAEHEVRYHDWTHKKNAFQGKQLLIKTSSDTRLIIVSNQTIPLQGVGVGYNPYSCNLF